MKRQGKGHSGNSRKAPATNGSGEAPVTQSTGAPLIVAIVLIASIALGLGYSLIKKNHEPNGIAAPAATSLDVAPEQAGATGSAAPADSAQPEKVVSYSANTLIN